VSNYKFIVNPTAARGKCARIALRLEGMCRAAGLDFDLSYTTAPKEAVAIADKACGTFENIIAVGGDGTIHEVVNGLIGKSHRFGIVPVGSGNDFVKAMGIPLQLNAAFDTLLSGRTRAVDVGSADSVFFPNGLGIGFDAWVVRESQMVKRLRGNAIYLYSVLRTIYKYRPPEIRIKFNSTVREEKLFMITVGNGISLGGGFKLTPFAIMDDGLLDLTIIRDLSKPEIYKNLLGVYTGKHTRMPQVSIDRTTNMQVESETGFAVHLDGELMSLEKKSLDISIIPKALEVIVPQQ